MELQYKIKMTVEFSGRGYWFSTRCQSDRYIVKLTWNRRSLTTDFYKGVGHEGKPPTLDEVMHSLLMDYNSAPDTFKVTEEGFKDFCENFGYDQDSSNTHNLYKRLIDGNKKFYRVFNPIIDELNEMYKDF